MLLISGIIDAQPRIAALKGQSSIQTFMITLTLQMIQTLKLNKILFVIIFDNFKFCFFCVTDTSYEMIVFLQTDSIHFENFSD